MSSQGVLNIAIVGGGAAGFFAAWSVKESYPQYNVTIIEKKRYPLSKVKISGGGRCNLTNGCHSEQTWKKAYPRGYNLLKRHLNYFGAEQTMEWFQRQGVALVIQADNCVFPKSQDSHSIVSALIKRANRDGVHILTNTKVVDAISSADTVVLTLQNKDGDISCQTFDKVIVTTGGAPKQEQLDWLQKLGHKIVPSVPSLYSFNISDNTNLKSLMGIVIDDAIVSIEGLNKYSSQGALLITHWGLSGPAILKLSSYAAREIYQANFKFNLRVNWCGRSNFDDICEELESLFITNANKAISNIKLNNLFSRVWEYLLFRSSISSTKKCKEVGKKEIFKLATTLTNDIYQVNGKGEFKDEFVTCGGICNSNIDLSTLRSKICPNIYFAGEVLDIDAITGGFNLQAAWTTGYVAGKLK